MPDHTGLHDKEVCRQPATCEQFLATGERCGTADYIWLSGRCLETLDVSRQFAMVRMLIHNFPQQTGLVRHYSSAAVMDMDTDCVEMLDAPPLEVQVPEWVGQPRLKPARISTCPFNNKTISSSINAIY